ncbi:hypothetical protein N8Z47_05220 [Salibacteraceae bacterium]|jgi:hypothetical protein|nr:hypothetical protein [Salibacteraceae bacterium]MDC1222050.1 hypothetical protein [Salibacteraceae bacterium]
MKNAQAYIEYLLKRFQILPLSLLVISDVLVIDRIVDVDNEGWWVKPMVFFMVLAYLFNNRVGDDKRDFEFDSIHYPDRAVQKGTIGLKQLERLGTMSMAVMAILSIFFGWVSMAIVIPVWLFGYWAKRDFSLPESFKHKNYFVYNLLNMLQMLMLQVFIYLSLLNSFEMNPMIWIHVAFVFALSLQVEVTRKIKPEKSIPNDLYSDRMGMSGAFVLWLVLGVLCIGLSSFLAARMGIDSTTILIAAAVWLSAMLLGLAYYQNKKTETAENLFWLALIFSYVGQNLLLAYG